MRVGYIHLHLLPKGAVSVGKKAAIQGTLRASEAPDTASFIGQTFSLSELAAALSPIAPDTHGLVQRIRHWTREGALHPSEFAHAGRGRHRQYGPQAHYCAAVLHYMTLAGLPVAHSQFLTDAMQVVRSKAAKWQSARGKGQTLTLPVMMIEVTSRGDMRVSEGKSKVRRDTVLKIEIDLARMFAEVDRGRS